VALRPRLSPGVPLSRDAIRSYGSVPGMSIRQAVRRRTLCLCAVMASHLVVTSPTHMSELSSVRVK
jgi:hypothetical protein